MEPFEPDRVQASVGGEGVEPIVQNPGVGAPVFLFCFVAVAVVFSLLQLVVPPAHGFDVQLFEPVPHVRARPAGIGEGGEAAPAEGEDAGEGEVGDGETGEERGSCALEREAEGEEAWKRIVTWGGEGEVLQAWERW